MSSSCITERPLKALPHDIFILVAQFVPYRITNVSRSWRDFERRFNERIWNIWRRTFNQFGLSTIYSGWPECEWCLIKIPPFEFPIRNSGTGPIIYVGGVIHSMRNHRCNKCENDPHVMATRP